MGGSAYGTGGGVDRVKSCVKKWEMSDRFKDPVCSARWDFRIRAYGRDRSGLKSRRTPGPKCLGN